MTRVVLLALLSVAFLQECSGFQKNCLGRQCIRSYTQVTAKEPFHTSALKFSQFHSLNKKSAVFGENSPYHVCTVGI